MAENIVINNTPPQSNNRASSSVLGSLVKPLITLITIGSLIFLIFALVLIVDNWEAIGVFFTTGFIGWLNPFDSSEGDTGPIESVLGSTSPLGALGYLPIIGPVFRGFLR